MAVADFVFLHGGGQGSWVWAETIAALGQQAGAASLRCLALDIPGCGVKRDEDTDAITFGAIIDELVAEVEAFASDPVVLVGHSQAGTVLPAMVARRPDLFARLIYVSCIAPQPGTAVFAAFCEQAEVSAGVRAFMEQSLPFEECSRLMFCNDMTTKQTEAFLAKLGTDQWPPSVLDMSDWPYAHLAGVPSTYVQCLADEALPPNWQERFAGRLHASRVVRIDAGHQAMNTRPHALAEILLQEAGRRD